MINSKIKMLATIISLLYENRKSAADPPIPNILSIAPKQSGQSFAENKVPTKATKLVPVFFANFPLVFSLSDAYTCMAIAIPNKEENNNIRPKSLACKIENWYLIVVPGVKREGIMMEIKAIANAKATAIRRCFLELNV
jgi:hypothetical protein